MYKLIAKLLASFIAAVVVSAGLVTVSSSPATAACPYTGCFDTRTKLAGPNKTRAGKSVTYRASVRALGSNATPKGTFRFSVKGPGRDRSRVKPVGNGTQTFRVPGLKRGTYRVTVRYIKRPNSAFLNSSAGKTLKVRKARRR